MPSKAPAVGLDYEFADPGDLIAALTHRSAGGQNNERLEFLGDAVLNLIIADELFQRRPEDDEGSLTRLRAHLVRGETLVAIARELELGDQVLLGPGELKSGGHRRASILADTLEAILGAVYLDGGFGGVREVILKLYRSRLDQLPDPDSLKDPKTRLQEMLQARGLPLPIYQVVEESGAEHRKNFRVACEIAGAAKPLHATGSSRRGAEQRAAALAIELLLES